MSGDAYCLTVYVSPRLGEPLFRPETPTVFLQASPLLLNSSAVAKMHMGEYQEAETILVEVSDSRHGACMHCNFSVSGVMLVLATTFLSPMCGALMFTAWNGLMLVS